MLCICSDWSTDRIFISRSRAIQLFTAREKKRMRRKKRTHYHKTEFNKNEIKIARKKNSWAKISYNQLNCELTQTTQQLIEKWYIQLRCQRARQKKNAHTQNRPTLVSNYILVSLKSRSGVPILFLLWIFIWLFSEHLKSTFNNFLTRRKKT